MMELKKYVLDLIRVECKLVYSVEPREDGTVVIKRMRLREEDRQGAPEYVQVVLRELDITTNEQEGD